jgi:hypothetical protein
MLVSFGGLGIDIWDSLRRIYYIPQAVNRRNKIMAKKTINLTVAMPTDGEGIENLNANKFAANIANNLRDQNSGYRYSVEVIENDGTAEDDLDEVPDGIDAVDAISSAFSDESSYNN